MWCKHSFEGPAGAPKPPGWLVDMPKPSRGEACPVCPLLAPEDPGTGPAGFVSPHVPMAMPVSAARPRCPYVY